MGSAFHQFTLLHYQNEISVLNGGEPVCDHNDRLALDQPFKGFLDLLLVLRVSVGGGLI